MTEQDRCGLWLAALERGWARRAYARNLVGWKAPPHSRWRADGASPARLARPWPRYGIRDGIKGAAAVGQLVCEFCRLLELEPGIMSTERWNDERRQAGEAIMAVRQLVANNRGGGGHSAPCRGPRVRVALPAARPSRQAGGANPRAGLEPAASRSASRTPPPIELLGMGRTLPPERGEARPFPGSGPLWRSTTIPPLSPQLMS